MATTTASLNSEVSGAPGTPKVTPKVAKKKTTITANTKLPANPFLFEILELANKQRTIGKRVEVLQEYRHEALVSILIWNFDEAAISLLPEGVVPYERNEVPVGTDHTSLRKEYRNLYHFVKGGNDSLSAIRRETMFIQMLEGLHPQEADILSLIKDGNLENQYPKVTKEVVSQAFPDIQWGLRG